MLISIGVSNFLRRSRSLSLGLLAIATKFDLEMVMVADTSSVFMVPMRLQAERRRIADSHLRSN